MPCSLTPRAPNQPSIAFTAPPAPAQPTRVRRGMRKSVIGKTRMHGISAGFPVLFDGSEMDNPPSVYQCTPAALQSMKVCAASSDDADNYADNESLTRMTG